MNDLESYSEIVKRVVEVVLPSMWSEECVFADVRARYHVIKYYQDKSLGYPSER